jgi:hypothetical protein
MGTRLSSSPAAADRVRERGEDGLRDEPLATEFDRFEWGW